MTVRSSFLQLLILFVSLFVIGCGADAGTQNNTSTETEATASAKVDAVTGYIDPVCRMKISPDATDTYTFEEVTYGFCSKGCRLAFTKDPAVFLTALEE